MLSLSFCAVTNVLSVHMMHSVTPFINVLTLCFFKYHLTPRLISHHFLSIAQCQDLIQNYIECVPTPQCLVGSTMSSTPQLRDNGIHLVSLNFEVQHPQRLSNTPLKEGDLLLCQFTRAQDKNAQFCNALRQIDAAMPSASSSEQTGS